MADADKVVISDRFGGGERINLSLGTFRVVCLSNFIVQQDLNEADILAEKVR